MSDQLQSVMNDPILSDAHVEAFATALRRGQPTAGDAEIIEVLKYARGLVTQAALLQMVLDGQCSFHVVNGEVMVQLMDGRLC